MTDTSAPVSTQALYLLPLILNVTGFCAPTTNYMRWYDFAPFTGCLTNGPLPFPGALCLQNLCMWPSLPQLQHLMTWFLPLSGGLSLGPIAFPFVPFFWHLFLLWLDFTGLTASIFNRLLEWQTSMGLSSYSESSSSWIFHFHSDRAFWYAASNVCGSSFITTIFIPFLLVPLCKNPRIYLDTTSFLPSTLRTRPRPVARPSACTPVFPPFLHVRRGLFVVSLCMYCLTVPLVMRSAAWHLSSSATRATSASPPTRTCTHLFL